MLEIEDHETGKETFKGFSFTEYEVRFSTSTRYSCSTYSIWLKFDIRNPENDSLTLTRLILNLALTLLAI